MPFRPKTHRPFPRAEVRFTPPEAEVRLTARERGYDSRWDVARRSFLAKHPLCEKCKAERVARAGTVVDHVVPHRLAEAINANDPEIIAEARARFWDSSNWQTLCTTHHNSTKQAEEKEARRLARIDDEPRP